MEKLLKQINGCDTIEGATKVLSTQIEISEKVKRAIDFTVLRHEGQLRKSGVPYAIHPILTASLVAYLGGDEVMVVAGLLHDIVEDTECNVDELVELFGDEVAELVEGLTKIMEIREDQLAPSTSKEKLITSALTFRKMLLASINDVRVLVVKLCDRCHNMLTLDALKAEKRARISEETLVVYVPIAHRLGISSIKNILEDLSFKYLLPTEFGRIDSYIQGQKQQFQLRINHFIDSVTELMLQNGFEEGDFEIHRRIKHHYSIYLKMQRKGISIEEVLDLLAIRIVVKTPNDCYLVLGLIHQHFNPLIARFKDYIAISKENGYQTIHTTVFDNRSIIEAQIRTYEMHNTAEYGVAAHWKYKSGGLNPKLAWLNELTSQEGEDSIEEFYQYAKDNLYSEDIAVFSPKGDVFTLPRGATVLDFAYEVHTEVGAYTHEAFVNRRKVPLLTELKNGDIVRVITTDVPAFRCSWINSVKTAKAKNAIKANCRQKTVSINHQVALGILMSIFNVSQKVILKWIESENLSKKIHKIAVDSVYLMDIVNLFKKYKSKSNILYPLLKIDKYAIKKQKFDNIVIYSNYKVEHIEFDFCCHPKRDDDIMGFRRGSEVIVHQKMCEKATKKMEANESMIFVKWTRNAPRRYKMIVALENKIGSLAAFLFYLAKMQLNLITITIGQSDDYVADYFEIIIELPENANVDNVKDNIKDRYKLIEFVSANDAYK